VWIATEDGLVKKDKDAWTVYTTANSPLLHNTIQSIDLDAAGNVC
jgi:ligand-binding sensor domain-containing protein